MSVSILSRGDIFDRLNNWRKNYHSGYLAMYSSQLGGIVTDPAFWVLPVDDHAVHRGDAVFEVFKCLEGRAYCLEDHLNKLADTAAKLAVKMPPEFGDIRSILRETVKAGGCKDCLVRLMVTRGPGGFSCNPYESPLGLLLITVLKLPFRSEEEYKNGVKVITAPFQGKDPDLATMKVSSYIQNVLVQKAAQDAGADYAVCFRHDGCMTESSTANVFIVTRDGELLAPDWETILRGTTLTRALSIAKDMAGEGLISAVRQQNINRDLVSNAAEAMISSTTADVLPITTWDGRQVGAGIQGPVAAEILKRMRAEYTDPASPYLTDLWS